MPSLETPVLTVDANTLHRIDTRNVGNPFSIWILFSRCSGSIEEGRRLENLSWRLWNRETFCCAPCEVYTTTTAITISQRSSEGRYITDIPDLSSSIDSIDEEAIEPDNEESASASGPLIVYEAPYDLEKIVITIKEKKDLEPLAMSTHSHLAPHANKISSPQITLPQITSPQITLPQTSNTASPIISAPKPEKAASPAPSLPRKSPESTTASDGASATSEGSATIVFRGFSPSQISSSYSSTPLVTTSASVPKLALPSNTMFTLGGSS